LSKPKRRLRNLNADPEVKVNVKGVRVDLRKLNTNTVQKGP